MSNESNLTRRIEDKLKAQQAKEVPQPITQVPPSSLQIVPKTAEEQKQAVSKFIPAQIEPKIVKEQIVATAAPVSEQKLEPKGELIGNNYVIKNIRDGEGAIYSMESGERITHLKRDASGKSLVWEDLSNVPKGAYMARIIENARNPDQEYRVWTFIVTKNI